MEGRPDPTELSQLLKCDPAETSRKVQTPPISADFGPKTQGAIRNASSDSTSRSHAENVTVRICEGCGKPLSFSLKANARFHPGGACKQKAYRARQAGGNGGRAPRRRKIAKSGTRQDWLDRNPEVKQAREDELAEERRRDERRREEYSKLTEPPGGWLAGIS
jgi:hypothetical protein